MHIKGVILLQASFQMVINFHYGSLVAASVAIVWGRKKGDHRMILSPVIAIHDKLVGPCDHLETIALVKCLRDVHPKSIACASRRDAPSVAVVRIGPQQIAHGALVGDLLYSIYFAYLVKSFKAGRKTSVQTKDLKNTEYKREQIKRVIAAPLTTATTNIATAIIDSTPGQMRQ